MHLIENESAIVAIYPNPESAERAIIELQHADIDPGHISVVGSGAPLDGIIGVYATNDRVRCWAGRGAMWGSLWGALLGSAFFLIPGIGPLVVMGPLVGSFVGALEGASTGYALSLERPTDVAPTERQLATSRGLAGVLARALAGMGIPARRVDAYELEVRQGHVLILAHGSADLVARAGAILDTTGAESIGIFRPDEDLPERPTVYEGWPSGAAPIWHGADHTSPSTDPTLAASVAAHVTV